MAGVILGLVIGKPLGILAMSWLVVRLGLATLPDGVNWRGILIVGFVAGIGFTMAIFIAQLAFADPSLLAIGKLGVLLASAVAGAVGLVFGYLFLPRVHPAVVAHLTPGQVEASSEYWTGAHPLPDSPPGGSAYTGTGRPRQMSGDGD
jgi:NhaA family Na+:H+ antiporter